MRVVRRLFSAALVTALLLSLPALLLAGTTGKIAGRVTDAGSGEPLASVNILLEGTNRGAASDLDGIYYIINLSPGTYTMVVSAIGYARQTITDVQVQVDRTTNINLRLRQEVVQGEEVTIKAQKAAVEMDRTFSTASVGDQDLKVMPITRVKEAIDLQAGVVDGHFRGGRSGEVVYMIDGIPVQDVYDNSQGTQVSQDVVKELQVITGTFNAEYGQAMSGVVNMVTKDGGDTYHGLLGAEAGDYLSNHTEEFYNIDEINPTAITNYQFSLSGPVPTLGKKLTFYTNGRFEDTEGWLYGWDRFDINFPSDYMALGDRANDWTAQQLNDSLMAWGIDPDLLNDENALYLALLEKFGRRSGKPVAMNPDKNMYLFGKLTYQLTPTTKLNYISMWEDRRYRDFDREYVNIPYGDYKRFRNARTNSLKMTSSLGRSAFVDVGYANNFTEYKHYVYEDIYDPRYYYGFYGIGDINPSYTMNVQGVKYEHFRRYTNSHVLQAKLAWQVTPIHYLVTGANYSANDVFYQSYNNDIADVGPTLMPGSPIGRSNFNYDAYNYKPVEGAFYMQDKIELKSLVVNAGLRFDYFDSKGRVLADSKDPDVYHPIQVGVNQSLANRLDYWYTRPSPKVQVSPRLGIGYPISDRGVLHFAYGHFFQRPGYEFLYENPEFEIKRQGAGLHTIMGNADLDAEKTISYEVVEQFGVPNWFVVSMGSGGTLYSLWKGFKDLLAMQKIEKLPRMIGVQASGCAPIVEAVMENESISVNACDSYTHALGIFVRDPVNGGKALRAIKDSGGAAVTVDDSEIFAAEQEIARLEGIFAEPSSSAAFAALKKLLNQDVVDGDESVVCLITGSGLKATDVLQELAKKRKTAGVGSELSTKEKILRILGREDTYGYDLWKKIGKTMTRAAIYQHLNDLARRGAVTSYSRGGRKYFRITERGVRALCAIDDLKMLL